MWCRCDPVSLGDMKEEVCEQTSGKAVLEVWGCCLGTA